jgi:hypothetical protein
MERDLIQHRLEHARAAISLATYHVGHQRTKLIKLERNGHLGEAAPARDMLTTFRDCLAMHVADRDRAIRELVDFDSRHPPQTLDDPVTYATP